jgi:hypothetical protein
MQFNTTDAPTFRTVLHKSLQGLPGVTDAGYTGYGAMGGGSFGLIFLQPNATKETFNATFARYYEISALPNVSAQIGSIDFPTWIDYCNVFLSDPNIATNVIDTSRLLTPDVLLHRTADLVDVALGYEGFSAGFNFSMCLSGSVITSRKIMLINAVGKVNSVERDKTAVHPIWKESRAVFSIGTDWADDAPAEEKLRKKKQSIQVSKRLGEIVGPHGGTYVNEANP